MIQVVLSSIPSYYLSLFKAHVAVCKSIERLMRNFLWKDSGNKNGSHLVRWDIVTCSKEKGELGIDKIKTTNEALLGKWIWRYLLEPKQLWSSLIDAKYSICSLGSAPSKTNFGSDKVLWFQISKMHSPLLIKPNGTLRVDQTLCYDFTFGMVRPQKGLITTDFIIFLTTNSYLLRMLGMLDKGIGTLHLGEHSWIEKNRHRPQYPPHGLSFL